MKLIKIKVSGMFWILIGVAALYCVGIGVLREIGVLSDSIAFVLMVLPMIISTSYACVLVGQMMSGN